MGHIRKWILWAGSLVLFVWIAWQAADPTFGWRQKLTLLVEIPAGEVMGSSVSSMRVRMGPDVLKDSPSVGFAFVGAAAFVEVGPASILSASSCTGQQRPWLGRR